MKFYFSLLFIFLSLIKPAFSQNSDELLAGQYFANGEFEKAYPLYEKLLKSNPASIYFYENLFQCYLKLENFNSAEDLVSKQQKRFPSQSIFLIDEGYILEKEGKSDKAKKVYNSIIKDLKRDYNWINNVANSFQKRSRLDYAEQTYLAGRKLLGDYFAFITELATIYGQMGNKTAQLNEFLKYLEADENNLEAVKKALSMSFSAPEDFEPLKQVVLQKVQEDPNSYSWNELLMWTLVQQKDFYGAFIQIKALEKRTKGNGTRLIELAKICINSEEYDAAYECLSYVKDLGPKNPNYYNAIQALLYIGFKKVTVLNSYTPSDLISLEQNYIDFIKEAGYAIQQEKELAQLYIFYLNKVDTAIIILENLVNTPRVSHVFIGECKLLLGDAYVMNGDVWESALLYGQVEKDFKEEALGQEAKFRNARLSYYRGEFEWAQAQLEVLKTATSQLISNNSLELSVLIQDNLGFDTTGEPLKYFANADLLAYRNQDALAIKTLDSIPSLFPDNNLADEIAYVKGNIYRKNKNWDSALKEYDFIIKNHSFEFLADNALYHSALIYQFQLKNKEKAIAFYEELITKYPGSLFVVEARKNYRALKEDNKAL